MDFQIICMNDIVYDNEYFKLRTIHGGTFLFLNYKISQAFSLFSALFQIVTWVRSTNSYIHAVSFEPFEERGKSAAPFSLFTSVITVIPLITIRIPHVGIIITATLYYDDERSGSKLFY
jgi:hypothetical protein